MIRFVRYTGGCGHTWGVETEGTVHSLTDRPAGVPSLADLTNERCLDQVRHEVENATLSQVPAADVAFLAPIPEPRKIVCASLNYRDHAEEQDEEIPEKPLLFAKAPTTVTNPGSPIVHSGDERVDYEVGLAVVVGRPATDLSEAEVDDYVAGYTVLNDVSGRDARYPTASSSAGRATTRFRRWVRRWSPAGSTTLTPSM